MRLNPSLLLSEREAQKLLYTPTEPVCAYYCQLRSVDGRGGEELPSRNPPDIEN